MPTYKSFKYCNFIELDKECGETAYGECMTPDEYHPRFVCLKHQELIEMVDEALIRMGKDYPRA